MDDSIRNCNGNEFNSYNVIVGRWNNLKKVLTNTFIGAIIKITKEREVNNMTMNTTYHARVERANRLRALEETLGFTKVVLQFEDVVEEKLYLLTSSGIIIVKSTRRDAIITAYMANVNQCYRLYKLAGKGQMSPKMEKRVRKNCERHPELFAVVG